MTDPAPTPPSRRPLVIVLIAAIALLVAVLLVGATVLVVRATTATDTPAAAGSANPVELPPTITSSPSAAPTTAAPAPPAAAPQPAAPAAPAAPAKPAFSSFSSSPSTMYCPPPSSDPSRYFEVVITWKTTNATQVFVGSGADASKDPYAQQLGPNDKFSYTDTCPVKQTTNWTVTAKGPGGTTTKTITIKNTGYYR